MTVEIVENLNEVSPLLRYLKIGEDAQKRNDLDAATKAYTSALRLDPDNAFALNNLSIILQSRKQFMAAIACARRAVASVPDNAFLLANMGTALLRMEHYDAAKQVFESLVDREPNNPGFLHNLGLAHAPTDLHLSISYFERALAVCPDEPRLLRDAGLMKLGLGRWNEGFDAWHRSLDFRRDEVACAGIPEWHGQSLEGKTIVVYHEQGFGDTVQFCRYLKYLKGHVILAVPAPLVRLMKLSNVADEVLDFADPPPPADYQSPLMSALRFLKIGYRIVEPFEPYLMVPEHGPRVRPAQNTILTVGVCWAGSPDYATDRLRSMPFDNFLSIADIPGVQLFSLQKGSASADVDKAGASALIPDLSGLIGDFADVSHVVNKLDLVVSVDTSVLHVAGALGKICLGLLPYNSCWRWGRRTDVSPFYPSLRLIRQKSPGDWVGVMVRVRQAIAEMLDKK